MKTNAVGLIVFCVLIAGAVFHIGGCHKSNGSGGGMVESIQNEFTPVIASFVTKRFQC